MELKALALADTQIKLADDKGTFAGYASTFGNVDSVGDTILKGAYKDTLKTNGLPKMFFNHDRFAVPIGKWVDAKEDDYGLLLTGEFTPGNIQAEQVKASLKHGTVDSLSIGFGLKQGDYQETVNGRTIKKVARLPEVSIVTFPADKFAKLDRSSIKSFNDEIEQIDTIRDFEYFLRDASGFSKGAAQALTARAKILFGQRDAADGPLDAKHLSEIQQRLERMAAQ